MPNPRPYSKTALHVFAGNLTELAHGQATVTSEVTLRAADAARRYITIKALTGGGILYVGTTGVTTSNGFEVKGGESLTLRTTGIIRVIASASTDVRFIEELA